MTRIPPISDAPSLNNSPRSPEEFESVDDLEFTVQIFGEKGWPIEASWAELLDELDEINAPFTPWRRRLGVESIKIAEEVTS